MNIALVVLDTLRKDVFDEQFGWLPGRRFERAWATSNWTAPVHASLFTGYYASEIGVHSRATILDCEETVLAEHLSAAGYTTRAFSANPNVSKRFEFHRGFDEFSGSWKIRHFNHENLFDWSGFISETRGEGPRRYLRALRQCLSGDVDTVASLKQGFQLKFRPDRLGSDMVDDGARAALDLVRSTDFGSDEFLFINLMEAHGPYEPPEAYRTVEHAKPTAVDALAGTAGDVDESAVRQAYRDAVRYLSDVYQDILEALRREFDYVFTISDHGEMLGEHGLWDHQYGVYPELTHVPLVVTGEGLSGSTRDPVSLLDVHRTVLDLAGVDAFSRGQNVLDDPGRECLTEYHGMTQWLLDELAAVTDIEAVRERYDTELYGIALPPSYYGHESNEGWRESGRGDGDPRERLDALRTDLVRRELDGENAQRDLSDEAMERLRDLGYA